MVRPLFVIGASRSGTTALTDYLNQLDEILICRERYKHIPEKIDPTLFTFERILDYTPMQEGGETNIPREHHVELLSRKDPAKIKWIGDKQPAHPKRFRAIAENNPGAHFIITYRPVEEVVESFEALATDPKETWIKGKDGLVMGVAAWNRALQGTREYFENDPEPNGLILAYHDFFYRNEECIPLLSRFLETDFSDEVLEAWAKTSREFEARRREKEPMAEGKAAYIEEHKDHEAEAWVLDRIERQWRDHSLYKRTIGQESARRRLAASLLQRVSSPGIEGEKGSEEKEVRLRNELSFERGKIEALERQNRNLSNQIKAVQSSRSWRVLNKLHRVRAAISGSAVKR